MASEDHRLPALASVYWNISGLISSNIKWGGWAVPSMFSTTYDISWKKIPNGSRFTKPIIWMPKIVKLGNIQWLVDYLLLSTNFFSRAIFVQYRNNYMLSVDNVENRDQSK